MKGKNKHPVQKEYAQLAESYDEKWHFYVENTLKQTLKHIEPKAGDCLLDMGCGTGVLLSMLEKRYPEVFLTGIDPTQEMLDIATKRFSKKIHIEQSWAEQLPFDDEKFDWIISCNMFHYIREPEIVLKEMMRVLKPTGQVVITDWCANYITNQLLDVYLRMFNNAHFKTYKKEECKKLLSLVGFDDINVNSYKINWFWGMMTATANKTKEVN